MNWLYLYVKYYKWTFIIPYIKDLWERPEKILFVTKLLHDVILTVLTEKEKNCKLSMIQQYFNILMSILQHIDSVIKAHILKPVEKNIGN